MSESPALARFDGLLATDLRDVTTDPAALDSTGWWAVVATFEGELVCARFGDVRSAPTPHAGRWRGPAHTAWRSSLDRAGYLAAVDGVRAAIAAGDVYQANLCRVLTAPLPDPAASEIDALTARLASGNPAPYAGTVQLPAHGVEVATASPELYLSRAGRTVRSGPIKGTAPEPELLQEKDRTENVMIVDLVRNDLGRLCVPGSVTVPALCAVERHPGLVHLVSTVQGELPYGAGWAELLAATFPPGSVSGAPKSSALRLIRAWETAPRGPYCGGIGWVDADRGTGGLGVGIRTFWLERAGSAGRLCFGTGAGITWGSDPEGEWEETELKARRLLAIASGERVGAYRANGADGLAAPVPAAVTHSAEPGSPR